MSCESPVLPAEAGRLAGEQKSVKTGLCSFFCVHGVLGLMLYRSVIQLQDRCKGRTSLKSLWNPLRSPGDMRDLFLMIPKIRGSWGWAFNHACSCYCGQRVVQAVRVKKHEVPEITKAGDKRRLSLWCTAILEAPGISGLWWSQQFQSRQDSPLVSMVVISQFDRGPKTRTSPAVSLLQSRHWGRLAALGRDVFLPLQCPRKWNDFGKRRREVSPAWSRRDTFPRLCTVSAAIF